MLQALGAEVSLVGLAGSDAAGDELAVRSRELGLDASGLVRSSERPTATKTRYLGYVQSAGRALQQIVRVDEEQTGALLPEEDRAVRKAASEALDRADFVVLQDMGKGLLGAGLTADLIAEARQRGKTVVVDPEMAEDYSPYRGASCVLPNRYEAQMATGMQIETPEDCARAASKLLNDLELEGVVIKLDRSGMYFATADGASQMMTTRALEVADITGAGDMVTAALTFARAAGAAYPLAVDLANFAAGLEVGLHGVAPVPREDLLAALEAESDPALRKIVPRERFAAMAERLRRQGLKVAFTNGCFDLLHLGHVGLIEFARKQGDLLAVGLNSDASVKKLKGPDRPVNSEDVRARLLASMSSVDYVILFDEKDVDALIAQVRPDVLVKGGDYTVNEVVGHEIVEGYGGKVVLFPVLAGLSTTDIIRKIAGNHAGTSGPDTD
jgi:D-beta-D-heptose 7-phosphate kinase/D-beta-D-heptose 1-phosphate adenosyltransferase